MRIAITGATGFIGRELVPMLRDAGCDLVLIGRDLTKLRGIYPGEKVCTYENIEKNAQGCDLVIHLAVANSNSKLQEDAVFEANVKLLSDVVNRSRSCGIRRFVNISSVHALDEKNVSLYARSKREALRVLQAEKNIEFCTIFLPAVYGRKWGGKMALLNKLPLGIAKFIFQIASAFRPTLDIKKLSSFILSVANHGLIEREIILTDGQRGNKFYHFSIRIMDITFAVVVLLLFWWLLIAVWLLVRMDSSGPGIFAQERVGEKERGFTCYKFRTMKQNTVQAATNEVLASAVTRAGAFLRRTKLDELPQIWNILRNEIGLVGPRPCLPIQKKLIEARRQKGVYELKPGISGLAQVNGIDMSDPERLASWDARYAALQSLMLDFRIMVATATGRGQGDRVASFSKSDHRLP